MALHTTCHGSIGKPFEPTRIERKKNALYRFIPIVKTLRNDAQLRADPAVCVTELPNQGPEHRATARERSVFLSNVQTRAERTTVLVYGQMRRSRQTLLHRRSVGSRSIPKISYLLLYISVVILYRCVEHSSYSSSVPSVVALQKATSNRTIECVCRYINKAKPFR